MPWKKFSVTKIFNMDYYRLLLRRYAWLLALPIVIYTVMTILFGLLMIPGGLLLVLIAGYALAIVPFVALLLFVVYTKKSEANHLLSLPLTRLQIFISQFLVGLTLIVIPLLWMSVLCVLTNDVGSTSEMSQFIVGMVLLAVIYFSFATLGCVLGGNTATQVLSMGVICFGPELLLVFVNDCVNQLVFGSIPFLSDSDWFYAIFPLAGGLSFIFDGSWPMWGWHFVLFILTLGLSVALFKRRPMELAGQTQAFFESQKYLVRPLFYFALVYMIFVPLSATMLLDGYYDTLYYTKVIVLLLCVSLLVVFLVNVWFSESFSHLFSKNSISQMILLSVSCCTIFFIPLFQRENMRMNILQKNDVAFSLTDYNQIHLSWDNTNHDETAELLTYIDNHRELFSRNEATYSLYFTAEDGDGFLQQHYRIDPSRIDDEFLDILKRGIIKSRQDYQLFNEEDTPLCVKVNGALYDLATFDEIVRTTWQEYLSLDNLKQATIAQDAFDYSSPYIDHFAFVESYLMSLTNLDFDTWFKQVMAQLPLVMPSEQLAAIEEVTQYLGTEYDNLHIVWDEEEKQLVDHIYLWGAEDSCAWDYLSIEENYVHAKVEIQGEVIDDIETSTKDDLFNGSNTTLKYDCEFKKENGQWTMYINRLEEVIY